MAGLVVMVFDQARTGHGIGPRRMMLKASTMGTISQVICTTAGRRLPAEAQVPDESGCHGIGDRALPRRGGEVLPDGERMPVEGPGSHPTFGPQPCRCSRGGSAESTSTQDDRSQAARTRTISDGLRTGRRGPGSVPCQRRPMKADSPVMEQETGSRQPKGGPPTWPLRSSGGQWTV